MGKNGQEEDIQSLFTHPTTHPPSDITFIIGTLKGNKQAIGAFKSFLDTLANDNGDSGHDSNDENYHNRMTINFFLLPTQPR